VVKPSQALSGPQKVVYLAMRRKGTVGRLPVAIVYKALPETNGPLPLDFTFNENQQLKDLALRGYLAIGLTRPGNARSNVFLYAQDRCAPDKVDDLFARGADYLQAVIGSVSQEPSADPRRIIVVANGGASMDSIALATRHVDGLKAIVNVSGGVYIENCQASDIVRQILSTYRADVSVPTLWLYADNDTLFDKTLVTAERDTYVAAGGRAELWFLHVDGEPGYLLNFSRQGRLAILPHVDSFLAKLGLPAVVDANVDQLVALLGSERFRDLARQYMSGPSEKALVASNSRRWVGWNFNGPNRDSAIKAALEVCGEHATSEACHVIMINNDIQQ
jgi:dienelactone hydrolase